MYMHNDKSYHLLHRKEIGSLLRFSKLEYTTNLPPLVKCRFWKVVFVNFKSPPTKDDFCSGDLNTDMNEVKGEPKGYTDKSLITLSRESILGAEINREVGGGLLT